MKNIISKSKIVLLLFVFLIIGTTSCDDEWLEPKPLSFFAA
jgi:hypothetical protein